MRVIFMGTPEFAVPSLRAILDAGHDVPLVVSTPDRERGRGLKLSPSAVKAFALERGLDVVTPESLKEESFCDRIRSAAPDVICVVAFRILPEMVYTIPRLGSFNLHGSLLPKYRGAAPINWAIINGEPETGVTTFFLRKRVDTGTIILQRTIPIGPEMTAGELHDVMMEVGAVAVRDTLAMIERGAIVPVEQDDAEATPAPKIFREDCAIDWSLPAGRLHDFIRGLSPHPGAFTSYAGATIKIYRSRLTDVSGIPPGTVEARGERLLVGTGTTALNVLEVQQQGKRAMTAAEFVRGFRFDQGEKFEHASPTA
ncbi:MAG TPA: methionyl-tRNA formyltransferase [Candidatus Kapabacteria bacterium]|nr:methionyl-tRNA formyltransferase [Candidatus Kapabacteria bacterium]